MRGLTFGDGFQFGCGFFTASLLFWIALMILGVIVSIALGYLGAAIRLPGFPPGVPGPPFGG
ncbi:MAG: hypothetical protein ACE5MB_08000 [Anaerolineae bacterium]